MSRSMTVLEKKEAEPNVIMTPGLMLKFKSRSPIVFEQVQHIFYVKYINGDRFEICPDGWRFEDIQYRPVPTDSLPWPPLGEPIQLESLEVLYYSIRAYIYDHLDLREDILYDILSCYVLASWRLEDFVSVCYLLFHAPKNSGKTRALEVLKELCYRSLLTPSITASVLFRLCHLYKPTLLLDESEILSNEDKVEVRALLNSGYRRGQQAWRVGRSGKGEDYRLEYFNVYGFKALATLVEPSDTLSSRCIIFTMYKNERPIRKFVDEIRSQDLRNKLLHYRFEYLTKNLEPFDIQEVQDGRLIELFTPLWQVAPTKEVKDKLVKYAKKISIDREEAEQATNEAKLIQVLIDLKKDVRSGRLPIAEISLGFNEDIPEKEKFKSFTIGKMLGRLGFSKCKMHEAGSARAIFYDEDILNRNATRFVGLQKPVKPVNLVNFNELDAIDAIDRIPDTNREAESRSEN